MRLVAYLYRTHSTRPTWQQPSSSSTAENKALYIHVRRRTTLNYCTPAAAAAAVVGTGIPMRLTLQLFSR